MDSPDAELDARELAEVFAWVERFLPGLLVTLEPADDGAARGPDGALLDPLPSTLWPEEEGQA